MNFENCMAGPYLLAFDLTGLQHIDDYALRLNQGIVKDEDLWFNTFRSGYFGCLTRIAGVEVLYRSLHSRQPMMGSGPGGIELLTSTTLFFMTSAIEHLTFALNSLGYAASMEMGGLQFRDITSPIELAKIGPRDIFEKRIGGYEAFFPQLQRYWISQKRYMMELFDHNIVSKHRSGIMIGTNPRRDIPMLPYPLHSPIAEVLLSSNPKAPASERIGKGSTTLENLAVNYPDFIQLTGEKAAIDISIKIGGKLYEEFRFSSEDEDYDFTFRGGSSDYLNILELSMEADVKPDRLSLIGLKNGFRAKFKLKLEGVDSPITKRCSYKVPPRYIEEILN